MSSQDDISRQRLEQLLASLNTDNSLTGYMIINQSGGVLLADLPSDIDAELISFRFLAIAKNSKSTLSELNHGKLKYISLQTEQLVISAFELSESWLLIFGPIHTRHKQIELFEKANFSHTPLVGKFLLDQSDMKKLGKITGSEQSELKMHILNLEASEDLQKLLLEIGQVPGITGCIVVGHDGLLIANTLPDEVDAESIGVWALGEYMNTEHIMKKLGHERVHQIVNRTPRSCVVIADFGGGLLVTITDGTDTDTLIPLMRKITDLVS